MTDRAPESALDALHAAVAQAFQVRLNTAGPDNPITAAEFTAILKFLKDNNITALPGSPRLAPLAQGLESLDDDAPDGVVDLGRFRTGG